MIPREPPPPPAHVAIIMDGNGRWAARRGKPRRAGHRRGVDRIEEIVQRAVDHGVRYLTLYAFSVENWQRPRREVAFLMALLDRCIVRETGRCLERGVRIRISGDRSTLPERLVRSMAEAERATSSGARMDLVLAVSYGGRDEIVAATRVIAARAAAGSIAPAAIGRDDVRRALYLPDVPDPDLLVRTGGERRLSNFLLWQAAYAELLFVPTLWPDFDSSCFDGCVAAYRDRERRFGTLPGSGGEVTR